VLTLGPPTELAAVLLRGGAALSAKIRSVTMMGGAVGVPGNITWPPTIKNPHAEWNFYVDPTAANVVFRSSRHGFYRLDARRTLTSRELEVVELIEKGLSNKEIAAQLSIAVTTVKNHVHSILDKLKVHRRGEAASLLRGSGPAGS
jgi:inosine-uridine nucleoside N-ribohydrolase